MTHHITSCINMIKRGMVEMKNKTIIAVLLTLLFFSQALIFNTVKSHKITMNLDTENIVTVSKKNSADYTTIQEALNNAEENQTIIIKTGTYKEILNIKKTIKIVGEENTIINPISKKNKYAIRLGAPNIIIKNLTIKNGAPGLYTTGIRISSSKNQIENCRFEDTPIGISSWTSENLIEKCSFKNCTDEGIALLGSKYSKCQKNQIKNCNFEENCDGIELQYSSKNKILNCKFYNNTHSGIDAIASSNHENIISNCEIFDNRVHGIYISSSNNNTIEKCFIYNNKDGNIKIRGNSENNDIKENNLFSKPVVQMESKKIFLNSFFTRCFLSFFSNFKEKLLRT